MKLIVEDRSTTEIAEKLVLNVAAIESLRKNIMTKLGVDSNISLLKFYYENQLY